MRVVKVMGLHRNLPMIREVVQQEIGDLKYKKGFSISEYRKCAWIRAGYELMHDALLISKLPDGSIKHSACTHICRRWPFVRGTVERITFEEFLALELFPQHVYSPGTFSEDLYLCRSSLADVATIGFHF